jgi:hypothetical protein
MLSDRKFIRALWFGRICLLFGTLGCLYGAYVSIFVNPDSMASYGLITAALFLGMSFFSGDYADPDTSWPTPRTLL